MKPIQHRQHVRRQALSSFSLQLFRDTLAFGSRVLFLMFGLPD